MNSKAEQGAKRIIIAKCAGCGVEWLFCPGERIYCVLCDRPIKDKDQTVCILPGEVNKGDLLQ